MVSTVADIRFMAQALRLARRGLYTTDPNPRVGCVLVKADVVVGEGWHRRAGEPHAEIHALSQAGESARGATAYVTLEPCRHTGRTGPCTARLRESGVARVVVAMRDPNPRMQGASIRELRAGGIDVAEGVLEDEAHALNAGFVSRMVRGRPFVRLKLATSLDGRTALASGESRWITSESARADVHRLRARSSAIMTGIGTVAADDPSLNVRSRPPDLADGDEVRQPTRIVVDSRLRTPPSAKLLQLPGRTLIATVTDDPRLAAGLRDAGAEVVALPDEAGRVSLPHLMQSLAAREMNEIHVECGATLAGELLRHRLVDELVLYVAASLLGDAGRGLARLAHITRMEQRLGLEFRDVRVIGPDLRIVAVPEEIE